MRALTFSFMAQTAFLTACSDLSIEELNGDNKKAERKMDELAIKQQGIDARSRRFSTLLHSTFLLEGNFWSFDSSDLMYPAPSPALNLATVKGLCTELKMSFPTEADVRLLGKHLKDGTPSDAQMNLLKRVERNEGFTDNSESLLDLVYWDGMPEQEGDLEGKARIGLCKESAE